MDNLLLTGSNPVVQPGITPDNANLTSYVPSSEDWYDSGFFGWLKSVSGINFYENLVSSIINDDSVFPHKAENFWEYLFQDPFTGYSAAKNKAKIWNNSTLGSTINDLTGFHPQDYGSKSDGNPFNNIPEYLADVFSQGIDMFNDNINKQYQYNEYQAEKQRQWEKMMSDTAYQRAVADLKAAGINPLLAFQGGLSPASTPSGANASGSLGNSNSLFNSMASSILGNKKLTMEFLTALLGIFKIFTGNISRS